MLVLQRQEAKGEWAGSVQTTRSPVHALSTAAVRTECGGQRGRQTVGTTTSKTTG